MSATQRANTRRSIMLLQEEFALTLNVKRWRIGAVRGEALVNKKASYNQQMKQIMKQQKKKKVSKNVFPNFYKLLQISMSTPISSDPSCERIAFLQCVKSRHFDNFSTLYIKKDIDIERVIDTFTNKNCSVALK